MPQLKLEFDEYKRPKNGAAKFIAAFNTFFRDYGRIETRKDVILFEGREMTRQDKYWLEVSRQIERLGSICVGTEFERMGKDIVFAFAESLEKSNSRFEVRQRAREREIMAADRRKERERQRQLAEEKAKAEGQGDSNEASNGADT